MFHVKTTGRTPHQDATGSVYKRTIVKFGETVHFQHPSTTSHHMTGGRRARKSKTTWERGIFLGKTYESDTFLMGTPIGVHLARTVRRLPANDQADDELMATIQGTPWDRKIGQIGRPKREALPQAIVPPDAGAGPAPTAEDKERPEVKDPTVDKGLADGSGRIFAKDEAARRLDMDSAATDRAKRKAT